MADTERYHQYQLEGSVPELYERVFVPMLTRPQIEQIFAIAPLHEGDRVLDAACGTGIVTRLAVERFGNIGSIVGVDLNPAMLEVARANMPTTRIPLEWQHGDLCDLPFPDNCFDVVLCNQGLQFVPDKSAALHEIRRVLVSGAQFVFTVWSENPFQSALSDALRRHVSEEAATSCLSMLQLKNAATVRKFLADAAFHPIEMQEIVITYRLQASVKAVVETMALTPVFVPEESRMTIGQEVCAALQDYRDGNELIVPGKNHLVKTRTP